MEHRAAWIHFTRTDIYIYGVFLGWGYAARGGTEPGSIHTLGLVSFFINRRYLALHGYTWVGPCFFPHTHAHIRTLTNPFEIAAKHILRRQCKIGGEREKRARERYDTPPTTGKNRTGPHQAVVLPQTTFYFPFFVLCIPFHFHFSLGELLGLYLPHLYHDHNLPLFITPPLSIPRLTRPSSGTYLP